MWGGTKEIKDRRERLDSWMFQVWKGETQV